jgi:hypothetical protein
VVAARLLLDWSPEQIAAHLRGTYPERPAWHVCHETIYQGLYNAVKSGLSRTWMLRLRTGRPLRQRRPRSTERQVRFVAPAQLISQRPEEVETRERIGDWEGKLIVGRLNKSAIGTLVERRSRCLRLLHLPHGSYRRRPAPGDGHDGRRRPGRGAADIDLGPGLGAGPARSAGRPLRPGHLLRSPGQPWMRGSNENTNGPLRQYFPKGSDLRVHTANDLRAVEERRDHRPRKILGWRTPLESSTPTSDHDDVDVATTARIHHQNPRDVSGSVFGRRQQREETVPMAVHPVHLGTGDHTVPALP